MTVVKKWPRTSTREIADCRVLTVHETSSVSPLTGDTHHFFVMNTTDWVNIVPVTENDEVVCTRQFRHGSEAITLEIPGGMVDAGEEASVAAARECLEETGYATNQLVPLGVLAPNPALFGNALHTFYAPGAKLAAEIENTATEQTEVQLIPFGQLESMLVNGEIDHALVAATLWRLLYLKKTGALDT